MRTKKLLSLILTLCIVLTTIGSLSIAVSAADVTTYQFYTLVGDEFIPNEDAVTEGVTWDNGAAAVDTSVMGKRIITGKDSSGNVKGIVNVGYKKWLSYDNNESYTVGDAVAYGSQYYDRWRRAASSGYDNFGFYAQDPLNPENTVVKYNGSEQYLDYFLSQPISAGNSFSVEMKLMLSNIENEYCHQLQMRRADNTWGPTVVIRYSTVEKKLYVYEASSRTNFVYIDTQNKEWMDLRFVVDGTTLEIYEGGNSLLTSTISQDCGLMYIRAKAYDGVGDNYIDDLKITDLTTTDEIYYGDADLNAENDYSFIKKADSTEKLAATVEYPLVDKTGVASEYTALLYNSVDADISELGTYSASTKLPGFDEDIKFNWTVYEKRNAWFETFEGYTEADLGKAPHIEPWTAGSNGKTIENDPDSQKDNFVLKYEVAAAETDWLTFTNNKSVNGKYSVSFKFMVPELYENVSQFILQLYGDSGKLLIETYVYFNASGNGRVYCSQSSLTGGTLDLIPSGSLKANTWYTVTYNLDKNSEFFTYELNDGTTVKTGEGKVRNSGYAFNKLQIAQRANTNGKNVGIYLDDIFVTKLLTIKEPVAQKSTVYKGDPIEALPERATVLLTDDETYDTAPVVWSAASLDTNTVGVKTVTGTVEGTDKKATLTLNVSAFPYEIVMPSLKADGKEVFGLIKGGSMDAAVLKKISNATLAGKVYAGLYDENMKLLGADVATIDTSNTWNKDDNNDVVMSLTLPNSANIDIDKCTLKLFAFSDSLVPFAELKAHKNEDIEQSATTVYIAGDSTASIKKDSLRPETGWGEAFATLCNGTGITVDNRAVDGQSSKSFYDQGKLNDILKDAQEGDYLFIQFGHNDAPGKGATHETTYTDGGTYEEYLTKYVTEARAKGVIPVILTSIIRATYSGNTLTQSTTAHLVDYAAAAKRVAAKYHVPVIDLFTITNDFFGSKTPTETYKYFDYYVDENAETLVEGNKDTTHLNAKGAEFVAQEIIDELKAMLHPLGTLFN